MRRFRFSLCLPGSGEFGVKQVLRKAPDVLAGGCEAEISAREVATTEVTGDHGTSSRESHDEGLHDSITSLGLCFLSGTEMGDDQRLSRFDSRHQMGTMNVTMKMFTKVPPSANVTPSGLEIPCTE